MQLFSNAKFKKIQQRQKAQIKKKDMILIVDDEDKTLATLGNMLKCEYEILKASNGEEALDFLKTFPRLEQIRLILSDQKMPKMNGVDFLEKTLDIIPDVIRIIMTAHVDTGIILKAENKALIYKYILKPFEKDELLITLRAALKTYELKLITQNRYKV